IRPLRLARTQLCAAPPPSASTTWLTSSPALIARTMPSATPRYVPARITWFTALTACPEPIGPTWVIVVPRLWSTGLARSRSAASPPMKIDRVPFFAPSLPPETGPSSIWTPVAASRSANWRVADGEIVDMSTTSVPAAAPSATPAGPKRTASTSGVSETMVITTSLAAATAAGLSRRWTPRSSNSAARPGVRFQALTSKPARAALAAIAPPIVPSPTNPTCIARIVDESGAGAEAPAPPVTGSRTGWSGLELEGLDDRRCLQHQGVECRLAAGLELHQEHPSVREIEQVDPHPAGPCDAPVEAALQWIGEQGHGRLAIAVRAGVLPARRVRDVEGDAMQPAQGDRRWWLRGEPGEGG